jgi:hypothetical protein
MSTQPASPQTTPVQSAHVPLAGSQKLLQQSALVLHGDWS